MLSMCVKKAKTHRKSFVLRNSHCRQSLTSKSSMFVPEIDIGGSEAVLFIWKLLYRTASGTTDRKVFQKWMNERTFSFITTRIFTHLTLMILRLVKKHIICTGNPFQSHHSNRQITKNTALQYNLALQYVVWLIIGKETSGKRWITVSRITPGSTLFTFAISLLIYWISYAALPEDFSIFCPLKGVFTSWESKDRGCWTLYELWRSEAN